MSTNKVNNQLFTEALRPKTLSEILIPERVRRDVAAGIEGGNFLFYSSSPGTGKTTLTRILTYNAGYDVLELNASLDNGIDIVREKIMPFITSTSLLDDGTKKLKVVVLEEMDQASRDFQSAIRAVLEGAKNTRFIANCNYIDKIIDPLLSRFTVIQMSPITKDEEVFLFKAYTDRVKQILTFLKISYTDENVDVFVRNSFPDFRTVIKRIQQLHVRGSKELSPDMLALSFDCSDLFNMILGAPNPWDNYKFLISEWSNKPEDAILQIGENLPEYIHTINPQKDIKIPNVIVTIAEHQHMLTTAIDKFIVLESLVFKLQMIMNS